MILIPRHNVRLLGTSPFVINGSGKSPGSQVGAPFTREFSPSGSIIVPSLASRPLSALNASASRSVTKLWKSERDALETPRFPAHFLPPSLQSPSHSSSNSSLLLSGKRGRHLQDKGRLSAAGEHLQPGADSLWIPGTSGEGARLGTAPPRLSRRASRRLEPESLHRTRTRGSSRIRGENFNGEGGPRLS